MAQAANPAIDPGSAEKGEPRAPSEDVAAGQSEDILGLQDLGVALNSKMHLVNDVSKAPYHPVELPTYVRRLVSRR